MEFFFGAGRPLPFLFLAIACCLQSNVFAAEESRPPLTPAAAAARGEPLYRQYCASCHSHPTERIPPRLRFLTMTPHTVFDAMTTGIMKSQAAGLTEEDRRTLAVLLSYQSFEDKPMPPELNLCAKTGGPLDFGAPQWNGWGRVAENSRFQPAPGIGAADVPRLKLKWAYAYPKSAGKSNGQPTVIGNRVFVTSEAGKVYSLDARTGCTYWIHDADSGVRTAVSVGPLTASTGARSAAYFGDVSASVYAVDAESGRRLWKTRVESHGLSRITGAPMLYQDRLYVPVSSAEEIAPYDRNYACCSFRGSIVALDARTGDILWKTYTIDAEPKPTRTNAVGVQMVGPAGAAVWSTPTIDVKRRTLYAATGNSYTDTKESSSDAVIALDLEDGHIKWRNQLTPSDNYLVTCGANRSGPSCPDPLGPDHDFGASPILQTLPDGTQLVIAGQKSGAVYALNPDSGKLVWQARVGQGGALGGIEYGIAADNRNVYSAVADHLAMPGKPGISAIDAATGKIVWRAPAPNVPCTSGEKEGGGSRFGCAIGQSSAVTVISGVVFSGALNGRFRAYSTTDGAILWDYNAAVDYTTVNAMSAHGGSFDAGGPTVVAGVLYMNSGYGSTLNSGNVLLAFTIDGK